MALDIQIGIQNNYDSLVLVDETGDYNAISNPGGWGTPNSARSGLSSDPTVIITTPGGTILTSETLTDFMSTSADIAFDLTSAIEAQDSTLDDGIWKFVFTFAGISQTSLTVYAYRDNAVRERLIKLSLKNLDIVDFKTAQELYQKMLYAFEAGDYDLVEELNDDLNRALEVCNLAFKNCGC